MMFIFLVLETLKVDVDICFKGIKKCKKTFVVKNILTKHLQNFSVVHCFLFFFHAIKK